jgi:large-conductance mechanosensitive channel
LTPFWVFPVPQTSDNGITRDDLITLGGAKKLSKFYFFLILATVVIFFSIQIRLFYISLIINSYKLHWVLVIQSIVVLFSTYIVAIWFLPSSLQDTYKHEPKFNSYSRRNFITSIVSLLCGVILGGFSKSISHSITNDILEPRFRSLKQKFKKTSICRQLELKALKEIREGNLVKASEEIYSEISRKENVANLNQFTRVFDLIIVLCYKDKAIYDQKFEKVISLAKKGNGRLRDKCKTWKNASKESIERKSKRKYWDKNEI